jgi:hypothetical protein
MNPFFTDLRIAHAEQLRARAVHDVPRLRHALHLIAQIAEREAGSAPGGCGHERERGPHALHRIAQLARSALVVSTPPDVDCGPDTDHVSDHR